MSTDFLGGGFPENSGKHPPSIVPEDIGAAFRLEGYFDSYAIFGPLIRHHVNEIRQQKLYGLAVRTVFLIDFTPMKRIHQ